MSEHAIPQNIMEYEFKLFAGLTVKQFVYAAIGGAGSYIFLQLTLKNMIPPIFGWPLTFFFTITTLLFTFFSYEKKSLDQWIQDWLRVSTTPLIRVWNKTGKPVKLEEGKRYKPDNMPAYLLLYFEPQATVQSVKNKMREHLEKLTKSYIIEITPENYEKYAVPNVQLPPVNNTVAFLLLDGVQPLEGVIAYLKDMTGKVLMALKSTKHGIIYFNKPVPDGTYKVEFEHPVFKFPEVNIKFKHTIYPLFKINPLDSNDV